VPLGLLRLDGVAKAVSLAEDDRQIAKARKEVLAAQQWMKKVHLIKAAQAPAKVLLCSVHASIRLRLPSCCLHTREKNRRWEEDAVPAHPALPNF
jgi:hypothetical protein